MASTSQPNTPPRSPSRSPERVVTKKKEKKKEKTVLAQPDEKEAKEERDPDELDIAKQVFPSIPVPDFPAFTAGLEEEKMKKGFDQAEIEYEVLTQLQLANKKKTHNGNWKKNRYQNIIPYENERDRVLLLPREGSTDYINASHMSSPLEGAKVKYIAASAPLADTIEDWWRMIWEQGVQIIIMLTKLKEKDKVKAERYWPTKKERDKEFGCMRLHWVTESHQSHPDYYIREIEVSHTGSSEPPRKIMQLQYVVWPDHGVPTELDGFIKFIQVYRAIRDESLRDGAQGPVDVHCSAGVGRTGCFLVVDYVLDMLESKDFAKQTINLFDIVTAMRNQRPGMVQTKQQYKFLYSTLAKIISDRLQGVSSYSSPSSPKAKPSE